MSADADGPAGLTTRSYEEILRNIHDGVYTLDPEGTITWVNEVAVEEFDGGYTREELVGAPVTTVLDEADVERCADLIADLVANEPGGSRRCEIDLQTADGRAIPCDLHLALLPAEDGGFAGTLGVVRDVTEQRRREQGLSVMHRVLRHNLRNELSIVLAGLERLDAGEDGPAAAIEAAVDRLLRAGEKARSVERALGREPVEPTTVDLGAVVEDRCAALRERYPGAELSVSVPGAVPVAGDDLLDEVVGELVENAIVHGGADRPAVEVAVEPPAGDDGRAALVVADDGPGIPATELEALEAAAETPLVHASGLGLWLVTWGVERLDGEVAFDTGPAGGTTVTVRLPAVEAADDAD